jgi:AraC-like DNA-binding protein
MNELEQKHQKDKKMGYVARQKALRKIINGSDKNDVETLKLHGIAFDFNKKLNVILLSIDNYADYCKMFTPDTRDLDSFGVINIANEIFMEIGVCETIDIDNGQFIIIINYVDENRISGLLDNLDEFIYKYGKIKVSSIIGECVDSLSDLVPSVLECTDAINYRLFFNGHMRVHISQIRQIQMKNTEIPESEIHNLTNVLMLGKRDELLEKCSGIFSSLNGYSYGSLKVFILKIVMSVQEAINQKGISTDAIKLDDWLEFLKDISQINSLDIIQSRLIDLFDNVQEGIDSVTRLKDMRFHKIYHDIQQAIEQEYNNRNFSPETISEKLNINAEYLKKMYKLNKGVSLSAEINQYRMKKAAELIINTSKPIAEIAQLCGFSNINYFYTFFKHNYGITAAEYRKLNFKEN